MRTVGKQEKKALAADDSIAKRAAETGHDPRWKSELCLSVFGRREPIVEPRNRPKAAEEKRGEKHSELVLPVWEFYTNGKPQRS